MSIHREIARFKTSPEAAQSLARALLSHEGAAWSDWELDFLEGLAGRASSEPLSTRQAEKLLELRDNARAFERVDGLSVRALIEDCFLGRLDLSEEDEVFVASLKAAGLKSLKLRPLKRLLACSRQLGVIDHYVAV